MVSIEKAPLELARLMSALSKGEPGCSLPPCCKGLLLLLHSPLWPLKTALQGYGSLGIGMDEVCLKRQSLEPAFGLVVGGVDDFEAEAEEEAVEDGVADVPGWCERYLR